MKTAKQLPNGNQLIPVSSPSELGAFLKAARKEQKLTQKDVAGLGNTGNRILVDIENGKPTVQVKKVFDLMDLLGLDLYVKRKGS